jgi:phage-related minor tail protein
MKKRMARESLLALAAMLAIGTAGGLFLLGGRDSGAVHADSGVTTEAAAAAAGARVQPTDPHLKVEPK